MRIHGVLVAAAVLALLTAGAAGTGGNGTKSAGTGNSTGGAGVGAGAPAEAPVLVAVSSISPDGASLFRGPPLLTDRNCSQDLDCPRGPCCGGRCVATFINCTDLPQNLPTVLRTALAVEKAEAAAAREQSGE